MKVREEGQGMGRAGDYRGARLKLCHSLTWPERRAGRHIHAEVIQSYYTHMIETVSKTI